MNESIQTIRPDSKGRVSLGKLAKGVSSFHVVKNADGIITLEPFVEIPAREKWLYDNDEALEAVKAGLKEAVKNPLVDRGSFANYAE